ncbi:unnamed protein product [Vitrella brassicaformis CCMP3155]|uniref:GST N-terminal domain-containing protein n=1 Tax=Vitrella brassicaformis (strain CCMP3155) TaxID=1169540 RepID=A0A0G4GE88_VITBC|nr:unnamed protein product [Vitrella brassicaformis CCMP3155]|eukprot:CEM27681.1 unnamed protein product [Vitrella brassicaformis CCMP3155]
MRASSVSEQLWEVAYLPLDVIRFAIMVGFLTQGYILKCVMGFIKGLLGWKEAPASTKPDAPTSRELGVKVTGLPGPMTNRQGVGELGAEKPNPLRHDLSETMWHTLTNPAFYHRIWIYVRLHRRGRWTLREGRKAPNCVVYTTEGERRYIYDFLDATKFLFAAVMDDLMVAQQLLKDDAKFVTIYMREAHPTDEWAVYGNLKVKQTTSLAERTKLAVDFFAGKGVTGELLIDGMDDEACVAYAAWPDRLMVLKPDGTLAFIGGPGPFDYSFDAVLQWMGKQTGRDYISEVKASRKDAPPAPLVENMKRVKATDLSKEGYCLFYMPQCPFCVHVLDQLTALGLQGMLPLVDVKGDPSQKDQLKQRGGLTQVPALGLPDGGILYESMEINAFLRKNVITA